MDRDGPVERLEDVSLRTFDVEREQVNLRDADSAEELEGLPPAERSALGDGPPPADMWQDWCDELRLSPEPPPLVDLVGAAEATANSAAKL